MPSCRCVLSKLTPAAPPRPPAPSGYEMAFAASSIRLTASAVEMSGLRSPFLTTTTMPTVASGVSVLAMTLPESMTSLYGGCTTGTSNGAPCTTCRCVAPPAPMVAFRTWPVFFSKPGFIISSGHRMPPGATRVTSSARADCAPPARTARTAVVTSFFMRQSVMRDIPNPKLQIPNPNRGIPEFWIWDLGFNVGVMTTVQDATKRKHKVAIMNAVHDLPVLVARDKGFFKDEGLDIEFVTTPGMAQVTTSHTVKFDSVFDRPLDSAFNEGGIDQYRMCEWGIMKRAVEANCEGRRGRKIVALGASMSTFAIVTTRDSNIYAPEMLKNKEIAG